MFSLIVSIIAIALASVLVLAAVYYGHQAYTRAHIRAAAAKAISQSVQVLGAAELYHADHERWPTGVDELLDSGYLRENPMYLASTPVTQVLARWGVPSAMADINGESGSEVIGGEDHSSGGNHSAEINEAAKNGVMRWDAPLKRRPTYWVLRSTDAEVCKEVNRVARGDNGIYKGVVPGLVTQCFGVEAPFTVVTTRDASPGYWQFLLEHWNEDDIFYSHDFAWSIKPTIVNNTYQFNPLPLGVGALPDWGTPEGGYLDGTIQVTVNGENTNTGSTAIGPSEVDVLIWGEGPDTWGVPGGDGIDMGGDGTTGGDGWGTGGAGDYEGPGGGGSGWGTGGVSISEVTVDKPGFTVTSTCPLDKPLQAGVSCKFLVSPPPLPEGTTSCVTYKVELTIETSNGTVKVPLSTQACPKEIEEELSKIPVKVEGLDEKDKADQWWFKDTRVGTVGTKWVRLTNTGTAPLYTDTPSLALKAPFSVASNECPAQLWPGSNCMVLLHFTPTAVQLYGNNQYPITLRSDIGVHSYYLNGYGLTALTYGAEVTPSSLFITPVYDGSSAYGNVTLKNTGNAKLNIDKAPEVISPTGVFSLRNTNCTSNGIGGYGSCQISVNIIPTKTGLEQGTLVISTVEGGVMQVPLQANVQVPFTMSGGKLPVGHAKSAYNSGDIRSFVTIRSGGSVGDRVKFVVTGLPYGLVFNPKTYQITGTIAGSVAPDTYNVNVTASFMDGKYTTKAVLQIPVEPIPESKWLTSYSNVTSYGNTYVATVGDYLADSNIFGNYIAMRNDALRTRALVKGQFRVSGQYEGLLNITNIYYLTPSGSITSCGGSVAADKKSAQCTRYPNNVGDAIGVAVRVAGVGSQPETLPGVYNNYIQFYPDEDSSVLAPTEPMTIVQEWDNKQNLIITDAGYAYTSSTPVTSYSYGNLSANSGLYGTRRFYLRTTNDLGRIGGTWKIVGDTDNAYQIDRVETWYQPLGSNATYPTQNFYCLGEEGPKNPFSDEAYCAAKWHPRDSKWSEMAVVVRFTERGATELGTKTSTAKLVFEPDPKWGNAQAVHPLEVSLTGNTQLTQGVSLVSNYTAYTTTDLAQVDFGNAYANTGTPLTRRFMIRQKDGTGQIGGTWKIDGVSNYRITRLGTYNRGTTSSNSGNSSLCVGRGNEFPLETERQSAYCTGGHPAKNTYSDLWVEVQYVPHAMTERGEIQDDAKLTFVPDTQYPFSLDNKMEVDLTAKTRYSNDIFLSLDNTLAEEVAETSFNKLATRANVQTTKRFFIRSQNRFSEIKGTWSLEGASNFTLVNVGAIHNSSTSTGAVCQGATGLALADVREATCEGYNPITGNYYDLFVDVKYTPDVTTTEGTYTHNAVLKFTPAEDKPLSALNKLEVALVGQTELDQPVVLTTGANFAAGATAAHNFGIRVPDFAQYTTKAFFIRSSTNYGKLSGTWKVEGDANFKIVRVGTASRDYSENSGTTHCTGMTTYNVSTTEVACEALYHPYNNSYYQDLFVVVQFDAEKTTVHDLHEHQAVLTFTPDQENHPVKAGAELKVDLSGQTRYGQIAVMVQGEGNTIDDVYASHTFKDLPADDNFTDTKRIYLRGTTNGAPIAGKWMIEGDQNFVITSVAAEYRNSISSTSRTYCEGKGTYSVASSQGPVDCVAGHPASVSRSDQSVDVTYRSQLLEGHTSANHTARLYFVPDDTNALFGLAPLEVQLSGKSYSEQSAFLTTKNPVPTAHETTLRVPDTPQNSYREAVMYLRGNSMFGFVGAKFKIEDASEQFTITNVSSVARGGTSPTSCTTQTLTATEASCKARHPTATLYSDVVVTVRFTPKPVEVNEFVTSTAKLIVEPLEGTPLANLTAPVEVELTSRTSLGMPVLFTEGTGTAPEDAITLITFPDTVANDSRSSDKNVFLRSPSTYGRMDGTWTITGGEGAFRFVSMGAAYKTGTFWTTCTNLSTSSTIGATSQRCRAETASTSETGYQHQGATIRFTPPNTTKYGGEEYTATLEFVPYTTNSSFDINGAEKITLELKGKSLFEQEISLTAGDSREHPSEVDFGQVVASRSQTVNKTFAIRGHNDTGLLSGSWVIEGDSAFTLSAVGAYSSVSYPTSSSFQDECRGMTSTATSGQGPVSCEAPYHPLRTAESSSYEDELIVQVRFMPGTTRVDGLNEYAAKLKFVPNPNYPVVANTPLEVSLKGSAFNGTSAVLSQGMNTGVSQSVYEPKVDFGQIHANLSRYQDKVFLLRATDRNGHIYGNWKVEGSSEFTIVDIKRLRYDTSATSSCSSPSATSWGGQGPYLCVSAQGSSASSDQAVTVRYTPANATHNGLKTSTAKLTFTPEPGYLLTPSQSDSFEVELEGTSINGVNYKMTTASTFEGTSDVVVDFGTYRSYQHTSTVTKVVFIRTDNTRGLLRGRVELVDDTDNIFTITEVALATAGSNSRSSACRAGDTSWGGKGPYLCEARNGVTSSSSHIRVEIQAKQIAATKLGGEEFTAKVKFTPDEGYPGDVIGQSELPLSIKMDYNAAATLSITGVQDTTFATSGYDFGSLAAGSASNTRRFFLRGSGDAGRLEGVWTLEGSSNFAIVAKGTASRNHTTSYFNTCYDYGTGFTANMAECAGQRLASASYSDLYVEVRFTSNAMTEAGTEFKSAVLKFTPHAKTPVEALAPLEVTMVGSVVKN